MEDTYGATIAKRSFKYGIYALILFSLGSLAAGDYTKGVMYGTIQMTLENFLFTVLATLLIVGLGAGAALFTLSLIALYLQYLWENRSGKKKKPPFQPANFTPLIIVAALAMAATIYPSSPSTTLCCVNFLFIFVFVYIIILAWDFISKKPKLPDKPHGKK